MYLFNCSYNPNRINQYPQIYYFSEECFHLFSNSMKIIFKIQNIWTLYISVVLMFVMY